MPEAVPPRARPFLVRCAQSCALNCATVAGIGHLRPASGTWASLVVAVLAVLWAQLAPASVVPAMFALALVAAVLGLFSASAAIRQYGRSDPSQVVIDEVAGQALALACIPSSAWLLSPWWPALLAFLLFRVFDIAKPFPVSWFESWPGAWGIMSDDIVAGGCAGLLAAALVC